VSYTLISSSSSSSSSSFISIFYFTSLKAALKPRSIKKLQRDGDGGIGILSYKKENKNGSGISSSIWKNQSATRPTSK
jgi:hypothetical protein